jgi:hypothetical protein
MDGIESMARHPGDAEAHAAGVAMTETYGGGVAQPAYTKLRHGSLVSVYAVGDYCGFIDDAGNHRRGHVLERDDEQDTYLLRCHVPGRGSMVLAAHVSQFAPF